MGAPLQEQVASQAIGPSDLVGPLVLALIAAAHQLQVLGKAAVLLQVAHMQMWSLLWQQAAQSGVATHLVHGDNGCMHHSPCFAGAAWSVNEIPAKA